MISPKVCGISIACLLHFGAPHLHGTFTISHEGAKLIDLTDEVSTVNKKTMVTAKAKREFTDTSANKLDMDNLRQAEKEGSSLLDSLAAQSDVERKQRIEQEKAEARANRWKTF